MPSWSIKNSIRTPLLLLAILEIAVIYMAVYVAAIIVFGSVQDSEHLIGPLWPRATAVVAVLFACLGSVGLYHFHQRVSFREVFVRLGVAVAVSGIVLAAVFYILPITTIPARMMAVAAVLAILMLLLVRYGFARSVDENIFRRRTLVFGDGERAAAISELRRRADRRGFKLLGRLSAPGDALTSTENDLIAHDRPLVEIANELGVDEIVIAMDDRRGNLPVRELLDCKLRGIDIIELVDFMERETGMIRIDLVNPGWLIFTPGFSIGGFRRTIKRVTDLAVASIVLLVSWPIMLLIAAAIAIDEGWRAPVFYRQERVGLHGNTFEVVKFRSMRIDAEVDGEAVWAKEDDERVTTVGGFLRKYRLDELPQVFNVLAGEMSLVGPRPERPEFVSKLSENIPYYAERHTVKPGVTGWAQLRYAYGSSEEDAARKLQYDLYYVKHQNLMLDILILLQTVEVVLWGKGAR